MYNVYLPRCSTLDAVYTSPVVSTSGVCISVTIHIRHESTFVQQSMLQSARADPYLGSKVSQETICSQPIIAHSVWPTLSVESFPLRCEIPAQRYRTAEQDPVNEDWECYIEKYWWQIMEKQKILAQGWNRLSGFLWVQSYVTYSISNKWVLRNVKIILLSFFFNVLYKIIIG